MIDEIATEIVRHPKLKAGKNLVVGISGIDGSGKSTLAEALEQHLIEEGLPVMQISLDDFLNPSKIRHNNKNQIQGYFEDNFDYDSLINCVLVPAQASTLVRSNLPVMQLDTDEITDRALEFTGPGVLIIEGVFLFRKEIREYFDLKIWLEISFEASMKRILDRPRDKRYGEPDAIRQRYKLRFFPTQRYHFARDQPAEAADMVFNVT